MHHSFDETQGNWDLRDARGRSARVYAPGAGKRDRREKHWYEKASFLKKAAIVGALGTVAGVGGLAYSVLKKPQGLPVTKPNTRGKQKTPGSNVIAVNFDNHQPNQNHTSMNQRNLVSRLEELAARVQTTDFAQQRPEEESHLLRNAAIGAGLGATAYGVGSYLRGRSMLAPKALNKVSGIGGHLGLLKAGNAANVADVRGYARTSGKALNRWGKQASGAVSDGYKQTRKDVRKGLRTAGKSVNKARAYVAGKIAP